MGSIYLSEWALKPATRHWQVALLFLFAKALVVSANGVESFRETSCLITQREANPMEINCDVFPDQELSITETVAQSLDRQSACNLTKNVTLTLLCETPLNMSDSASWAINFTEMVHCLPHLISFSAGGCKLTKGDLIGHIPRSLRHLDLSNNELETLPATLFQTDYSLQLTQVDLSNNTKLRNLPESFLNLMSINKLWLGQHNLTCAWVASHLFRWYKMKPKMFQDAEYYDCKTAKDEKFVRLSVHAALMAKKVETEHCQSVSHVCNCSFYTVNDKGIGNVPSSFRSYEHDIYITLKVNCSHRNLTSLPRLSKLVRFLNASYNHITSVDELGSPEYQNLGVLDLRYNEIESIDSIIKARFVRNFDVLGLSNNKIRELKSSVLKTLLENVQGHGRISLGENVIHCTCDTYQQVKTLLAKYREKVYDAKHIACVNLGELPVKVQELEAAQVCDWGDENSAAACWYWVIAIEVALILGVIIKVSHDSHQYRQEGVLPWCSQKMPRLPCEFMLE